MKNSLLKLGPKQGWFLGFTAVFALLAGYLFWGTWSTDFTFVQPDAPLMFSPHWASDWWRVWRTNGRFIPNDLLPFVGSPYFWQELVYALALYCSGLGLAYFLRGRGLPRLACYGAGLLLAFCGYWCTLFSAGHAGWFYWMAYGLWAFGLIDRAVRKGKAINWILLGATVGWGAYRQSDLWLLFTAFTGVYFVCRCIVERKFPWKGMLMAGASLFVIGGAAFRSALVDDLAGRDKQIEEGQTVNAAVTDETEKRWIFVTNWSLPPEETKEFFVPRVNGDTSCPFTLSLGARHGTGVRQYAGALGRPKDAPSGNYRQHSLYVGWITCLLALCGVGSAFLKGTGRRPEIVFFAVAAVIFWLFSMGRYCECVYRLVFALPFGDYLRAPVKWHHLTEFCLCVLAGYGIAGLMGLLGRMGRFAPWIVGAVVVFGACDLARIDRLYCAPVDLREAKRQNCSMQMTFLRKGDFNNPQVAAMVRAKKIVALAQPNPETYLVGVLQPWGKNTNPMPPMGTGAWLSILSMLGTVLIIGYGATKLRIRRM